jgi:hypothetical protein
MSIRTTVTLDDDVLHRVRQESRARGLTFRATLNELVREALVAKAKVAERSTFQVVPTPVGLRPGLSYDDVETLLSYLEGEDHR